jgi:hypothetical protein
VLRIALPPLVVMVLLEIVTRAWLLPASRDFRRFPAYPARAQELVDRDGLRIALVGNSATEQGVESELLAATLEGYGLGPVHVDHFVADGSQVNTWYFILERCFWSAGRRPDLVVLNFFGARGLADEEQMDIGRLAQCFTTVRDWPEVFQTDLPGGSQRVEFALSSFWATYATRQRIKDRLLGQVIPAYKDFTAEINRETFAHQQRQAAGDRPRPSAQYRALERLLRRAREQDSRLCFVAFPYHPPGGKPYEVDSAGLQRLAQEGTLYLDLRQVDELAASMYQDEVHLNQAGRSVYSRRLARALAPLLKQLRPIHTASVADAQGTP